MEIDPAKTVLVDMDGVLADFDAHVLAVIAARHPQIKLAEPLPEFYLTDQFPEHRAVINAISSEPGFFEALPVVDGAVAGWQRIITMGLTPRICSSPLIRHTNCRQEKLNWLGKYFVPLRRACGLAAHRI